MTISMIKNWSYKKRVFGALSIVFFLFMLILFPFGRRAVNRIIRNSLEETSRDLILELQKQPDEAGMLEYLKNQDPFAFFNVGLINDQYQLIYDVYLVRQLKESFQAPHPTSHVEVTEAFKKGKGYDIGWSEIFDRRLAYVAIRFDFKNKVYVLRTAFPYTQVEILVSNFQLGIFTFNILYLVFFSLMIWWVFIRFSRPIQEIIEAIRPYQEGHVQIVPKIVLKNPFSTDFEKLAATLNRLSEKVESQIKMEKDFVANASHELRTPITIIKGFTETLQDFNKIPPDVLTGIIEKIVRNCERMDTLIKNLLTLAGIETLAESRFQSFELGQLIYRCEETLRSLYPDVHLIVHCPPEKIVLPIDSDLVEMAFMNLLENGVKYSRAPAQIIMNVREEQEDVKIEISDQGIGIAEEDLQHIFERFYTVNKSHSRKLGGAGLGLAIAKTIIDIHQGSITVKSTLGQGTTFTITLPRIRYVKS